VFVHLIREVQEVEEVEEVQTRQAEMVEAQEYEGCLPTLEVAVELETVGGQSLSIVEARNQTFSKLYDRNTLC
jgi:hypothetical protein